MREQEDNPKGSGALVGIAIGAAVIVAALWLTKKDETPEKKSESVPMIPKPSAPRFSIHDHPIRTFVL